MSHVSQETAAEFVRLYDSLIAAGYQARCDAYGFKSKYEAENDQANAERWGNIIVELSDGLVLNRRKRNKYAVIAGPEYDLPAFLKRQAN